MTPISIFRLFVTTVLFVWASCAFGQTTYFYQDFSKAGPFVSPTPDAGQFSHIVQTAPALSYSKFHIGYMELVRTQQDSATGGIVRVLRATPFEPYPETLFIQIRLSAEAIQSDALNAIYFYVGEHFNPDNHSFPGNALMFGKFSINFLESAMTVKDLATQFSSKPVGKKKIVTLTWILNNSPKLFGYKLASNAAVTYNALPGSYDLWIDNEPVSLNSKAYPGNSLYSKTKLSNFEIRFRNGQGKIRIHEMLIREGASDLKAGEMMVAPNPASRRLITLRTADVKLESVRLANLRGQNIAIKTNAVSSDKIEVHINEPIAAGIYILCFVDKRFKTKSVKVMIE
jgi:hypothetical protein